MPKTDQFYLNNSKVARVLACTPNVIEAAGQDAGMAVSPIPSDSNVRTIMRLIGDPDRISLSRDITHYDICVADGIYTLYKHGYETMTPEMIARAMDGNSQVNVSQQRIDAIKESVDKMRRTFIRINCTDEMAHRKKKASGTYESYLIPADRIDIRADNQVAVTGYKMLRLPALYEYAEHIHQIIAVPIGLVNNDPRDADGRAAASKRIGDRDERIVLRHYIVRRISSMKNRKASMDSRRIAYSWIDAADGKSKGLFAELGYRPEDYGNWKKKRGNIHKQVREILDDLAGQGFISGYSEYREGDSMKMTAPIAGVVISFEVEEKE